MAGTLTVIWWRDIPAQVVVRDGRQTAKIVLHPRFQVAIDKAAVKAGRKAMDDYIAEWHKTQVPCTGEPDAAARAEAARLEQTYTREVLVRLVAAGGAGETPPNDGAAA
ncbi:MAG TPA: virulence factor [Candidatus Baltobacteraceae bacterium]|nr:virulence factor [Candidatus Baltobacteraceae bacterium]